jgi:hypothetical protein
MQCPPGASAGSGAPHSEQRFISIMPSPSSTEMAARCYTFLLADRRKQISNFFIDLVRSGYRVGDLAPEKLTQPASQPMQRDPQRSFIHPHPVG